MSPKVAAVTMAYNEAAYLPVWARHYARQVGADHCYVVDHGSTEPLALPPGVNTLRLPRSPHDDRKRALFVSSLAESLLEYYDWVIHTDVDEIVLADPGQFANLAAFCARLEVGTATAIGLDVQQIPGEELALDPGLSIGAQRGWVRFSSALCKPVLTRQPIVWSPGFHGADLQSAFSPLYLFHLHWADSQVGLGRLRKTRTMPWADLSSGPHQRMADSQWTAMFESMGRYRQREPISFHPSAAPLSEWIERTEQSCAVRPDGYCGPDLDINATELWPIPPRFRARL